MSYFKRSTGNGSTPNLRSSSMGRLRDPGENINESIDLEDIIESYDGVSRQSKASLASILNTQRLSQSFFSVYETLRDEESISFHSALQDGFSFSEHQSHRGLPGGDSGSCPNGRRDILWDSEEENGERDMMLPQSTFQVFWHDLSYQIKPKLTFSSLWNDFEQATKLNLSSLYNALNCGRSASHDIGTSGQYLEDNQNIPNNGREPLKIIQQISGSFKSGELTAVMGPSGAGKTSLLNFLSRRQEEGYSGSLYVDNSYRRIKISTIPQHDHLPEYLTVRENLLYASRLKNPQKNYDHVRNVEKFSGLLGLDDCLHTRTKKISGGQHKRLAIAQELLSKPDILILDEPTSGLDSLTCYKTLAVLRDLVKSSTRKLIDPIAIVLTIHQPQQDVFDIFDKIYVMANGGIAIYDGPPNKCTDFIEKYSGLKMQDEYYNPASFVIEIASGQHGDEPIMALEAQVKMEFDANRKELTHRLALKSSDMQIKDQNKPNKQGTKKYLRGYRPEEKNNDMMPPKCGESGSRRLYVDQRIAQGYTMNKGSFWKKTFVLAERYWISIFRDPKQMIARVLFHIFLPVFLALMMGTEPGKANACPRFKPQYQLNDLVKDNGVISEDIQEELFLSLENIALLFMMIYSLVAANIGGVTLSFTLDMQSSLKEYYNGWYSMTSYVIARNLADIPTGIFLPVLTLAIGYPLTGQLAGQGVSLTYRILITALAIVLGSTIGQTVGMIVGAIYIGHVTTALFVSQAITLPLVFLSGFVVRTKNMAKFVYGLSYISYYRHTLDIAMIARYGFNACNCNSTLVTGKEVELLGVSDRLKHFTEYWLNSMAESSDDDDDVFVGGVLNSTIPTTTTTPPPSMANNTDEAEQDIFGMFAKQISLYNTYGVNIKSCKDVIPHQLFELSLDETHLSSAFLTLILSLITVQILLFVTVKLVVHFRKSL